ncbi:hypothetical protein JCM11251_005945 [Rhodosporidiobolus azoricus]
MSAAYSVLPGSPLPSPVSGDFLMGADNTSCLESPKRERFVVDNDESDVMDRSGSSRCATVTKRGSFVRQLDRRQWRYILVLAAISLVIIFFSSSSSTSTITSALPSLSSYQPFTHLASSPLALHPTLVGPRPLTATNGKPLCTECSADELLLAVKEAKVRGDGASRFPNATKQESVALEPLFWSFDMAEVPDERRGGIKSCGTPHVYSAEEACELLGAYGGLLFAGDSFAHHVEHALLIILRDRNDGGVIDFETTDDCRGEQGFAEAKTCKMRVPTDTSQAPVCGDRVHMHFVRAIRPDPGVADGILREFSSWRSTLPRAAQMLSPVFIPSISVHFNYDYQPFIENFIPPTLDYLSRLFPAPLHIFGGPHKPADNQLPDYREIQGPHEVRAFKEKVEAAYLSQSEEKRAERGGARYFDTYGMTDGAASFDGAHMGFIPNLEKAHILLNLLDLWWSDIVQAGGLVEQG